MKLLPFLLLLVAPAARAAEPSPPPEAGRGVGIGVGQGARGDAFDSSVRLRVPLGEHFAAHLRVHLLHGLGRTPYRLDGLARLELTGSTAVLLGLLRIYGGGGAGPGVNLSGLSQRELVLNLGGYFGLEAFLAESFSFWFEIGAQGNLGRDDAFGAGGAAVAGLFLYL